MALMTIFTALMGVAWWFSNRKQKHWEGMETASTSTAVSIDGGTLASLLFKLKNSHGDAVSPSSP